MTDFIEPNLPGLYVTANGDLYLKDSSEMRCWMDVDAATRYSETSEHRVWFEWYEMTEKFSPDDLPLTRISPDMVRAILQGLVPFTVAFGIKGVNGVTTMLGPCIIENVSDGVFDVTIRDTLDETVTLNNGEFPLVKVDGSMYLKGVGHENKD